MKMYSFNNNSVMCNVYLLHVCQNFLYYLLSRIHLVAPENLVGPGDHVLFPVFVVIRVGLAFILLF